MLLNSIGLLIVGIAVFVLITIVAYKIFIKKERVDNSYTPFDYITGQTDTEFHEEEIIVEDKDNRG
ncbi:DUF3951 domain-containing protein [Halobacillus shinanisalinarum]|uniref:DUF3951 domain-containing protein n=1 Tax=Halobacillus shinanisalinarum TaxID=2932258 RepID=A0ABY4GWP3_9BACI|nr:DUF3951 domain-containing protein [Halobacillus shinanisalinarum]UOQ92543.1 DUF3951 domain-containing protein [Halobacillus shinanisalinarum]